MGSGWAGGSLGQVSQTRRQVLWRKSLGKDSVEDEEQGKISPVGHYTSPVPRGVMPTSRITNPACSRWLLAKARGSSWGTGVSPLFPPGLQALCARIPHSRSSSSRVQVREHRCQKLSEVCVWVLTGQGSRLGVIHLPSPSREVHLGTYHQTGSSSAKH